MRFGSLMGLVAGIVLAGGSAGAQLQNDPKPLKLTPPAAASLVVPPLTPENTLNLMLTTGGPVVIQLRPDKAPISVERIRTLTQRGFYNGLTFHRVIEDFMAQTGDPKGDGTGGSDLPNVAAEFNDMPHVRGEVSMARAEGKDSANSQFFIMLAPNLKLDGKYSPFGRIVAGMTYVDAIQRGEPPANPSRIVQAWVGATDARPPLPPVAAPSLPVKPAPPAATLPSATPSGAAPASPDDAQPN